MKPITIVLFLIAACLIPLNARTAPTDIVVQSDEHLEFARELCRAALAAAGMDASFSFFPVAQEKRLNAELTNGNLHVAFMPPDPERMDLENRGIIKSIKVPLERGMLGYRICLLREADKDLLKYVESVDDLKHLTVGLGLGWGDIAVYTNAGITVVEAPFTKTTDPLKSLVAKHFDALPLGVNEYQLFLQEFNKESGGVVQDKHIAIRYPWYRYVWISTAAPHSAELYEALSKGFGIIASNGEFITIYEKFKGALPPATLSNRRTIELENPYRSFEDVEPRFKHLIIPIPR